MMAGLRLIRVQAYRASGCIGRNATSSFLLRRNYASWSNGDDQGHSVERVQQVVNLFRQNSELRELLDKFQKLLEAKGIMPDGKQPSVMLMLKILTDKEVRNSLKELKDVMDKEGIQLSKEDLNAFMSLYGLKK